MRRKMVITQKQSGGGVMRKNGRGTGTLALFLRTFQFSVSRYRNEGGRGAAENSPVAFAARAVEPPERRTRKASRHWLGIPRRLIRGIRSRYFNASAPPAAAPFD